MFEDPDFEQSAVDLFNQVPGVTIIPGFRGNKKKHQSDTNAMYNSVTKVTDRCRAEMGLRLFDDLFKDP